MSVDQTTIFVKEDKNDVREITTFNLKSYGYNINKSSNGEEGLRKTSYHNPELILLDIMLSGIYWFQFCSSFRKKLII